MTINKSTLTTLSQTPSLVIHILTIFTSIGYGVFHFFYDIKLIGVSALFSAGFCFLAVIALLRFKPNEYYYYGFFGFQFVALMMTCYLYGIRGLILIYPITASLFYIFSYRMAFWAAFIFFAFGLAASSFSLEPALFIRVAIAMALSVTIAAAFSYVVDRQQKLLEHEANHDHLTKVFNRRGFSLALENELVQKKKEGSDIAFLFLDLDGFKHINDTKGHDVGDKLLTAFAQRILSALRSEDLLVSHDRTSNFARLSGDEFALVISDISSREAVEKITLRLIEIVGEPFRIASEKMKISISVGISFASEANFDYQMLLKNADFAMYKAKDSGKNGYHFFSAGVEGAY